MIEWRRVLYFFLRKKRILLFSFALSAFSILIFSGCDTFHPAPEKYDGTLSIELQDLPLGSEDSLAIHIVGPKRYELYVNRPVIIRGLLPGIYKISLNAVIDDRGLLYEPYSFSYLAEVKSGAVTHLQVPYRKRDGVYTLKAKPTTLVVPGNLVRRVSQDAIRIDCDPGSALNIPNNQEKSTFVVRPSLDFPFGAIYTAFEPVQAENICGTEIAVKEGTLDDAFSEVALEDIDHELTAYELAASMAVYKGDAFDLTDLMLAYDEEVTAFRNQGLSPLSALPIILPHGERAVTPLANFKLKKKFEKCYSPGTGETYGFASCIYLKNEIGLNIDLSYRLFPRPYVKNAKAILELEGNLGVNVRFKQETEDPKSLVFPLATVAIGSIYVTPSIYIQGMGLDLTFNLTGNEWDETKLTLLDAGYQLKGETGFEYSNGETHGIAVFHGTPYFKILDIAKFETDSISAEVKPEFGLLFLLYNLIGPYAGFEGDIDLEQACSRDKPFRNLGVEASFAAGIKSDIKNRIQGGIFSGKFWLKKYLLDIDIELTKLPLSSYSYHLPHLEFLTEVPIEQGVPVIRLTRGSTSVFLTELTSAGVCFVGEPSFSLLFPSGSSPQLLFRSHAVDSHTFQLSFHPVTRAQVGTYDALLRLTSSDSKVFDVPIRLVIE